MKNKILRIIILIVLIVSLIFILFQNCTNQEPQQKKANILLDTIKTKTTKTDTSIIKIKHRDTSDFERILIKNHLVNMHDVDSSIKVDLRYSTTNNFLHKDIYGDFDQAYLQPQVAKKLKNAQQYLKDTFPNYSLIIFDAVRPRSIQQIMWNTIKVSPKMRPKYLSNPKYGSLHNFGAAVDISIVDSSGKLLDMATDFDCFKELAYPTLEKILLKKGKITQQQINNRKLLRKIMAKAGFFNIQTEWWHFNSCHRKEARLKYKIIENHTLPKTNELIAQNDNLKYQEPKSINVSFKVQIKTSSKPMSTNSKIFKGLKVYRYYHKGLYKYTSGIFKTYDQAIEYRQKMRDLGFKDSFVAGFNNNKRIGIRSAIELSN